jgi:hemolysin activation/secretion protein
MVVSLIFVGILKRDMKIYVILVKIFSATHRYNLENDMELAYSIKYNYWKLLLSFRKITYQTFLSKDDRYNKIKNYLEL